jgi:hypothetical protein
MKKDKKIKMIKYNKTPSAIANDQSFNCELQNGFLMHIANQDGTQGILSKLIDGEQYFLIENVWVKL